MSAAKPKREIRSLRDALFNTRPGEDRVLAVKEFIKSHNVKKEITSKDQNGFSILAQAAFAHCDLEVMKLLVKVGASLNTSEPKGMGLLHTMVANQRPDGLKIFLTLGADWFQEWKGHNALWFAIKLCSFHGQHAEELYTRTIEVLAHGHPRGTKGTSNFKETESKSTALHVSAKYGNLKVANMLIQWEASIDEKDQFGHTPLWVAAAHGHVDVAMLLIRAGANVEATGVEGSTPLRVASRNGGVGKNTIPNFVQMVAVLLASGANELRAKLSREEAVGATQQALASMGSSQGGGNIQRLAASESQVNAAQPQTGRTALHEAAFNGDLEAVKSIIDLGADLNCRDNEGYSPMELAVYRDDFRIDMEAEKRSGQQKGRTSSTTNTMEDDHETTFAKSKSKSNPHSKTQQLERRLEKIAILLIVEGCDIGTETQGRQLIWTAAMNGWNKFISALFKHPTEAQSCKGVLGKDLVKASPQWHGCPALWVAVQRGHYEVVRVLLKGGAKPESVYKMDARYTPGPWLKALVPNHGDKSRLTLVRAEGKRRLPSSQYLIGGEEVWMRGVQKVRPSRVSPPDGTSALHQAALNGHLSILDLLIKNCRNVDQPCNNIKSELHLSTPLHYAALAGWYQCCLLLLKAGANVNALNHSKLTPLLQVITAKPSRPPHETSQAETNKVGQTHLLGNGGGRGGGSSVGAGLEGGYDHQDTWISRQEIVSLLVEQGADLFAKDFMGRSAQQLAAEKAINVRVSMSLSVVEAREKLMSSSPQVSKQRPPSQTSSSSSSSSSRARNKQRNQVADSMANKVPPKEARESAEKLRAWMEKELR